MPPTLADIAQLIDCPAPARGQQLIKGVSSLVDAEPGEISFLVSDAYRKHLDGTRASAVIVQADVKLPSHPRVPVLIVPDADLAVGKVLAMFAQPVPRPPAGIDATARVDPTARIDADAAIGPFCVVGARAVLGKNATLHAGVFIGDDVVVGHSCEFFPHVTIRERVTIGNRVIIHANSVLGTDGFGYRWDGSKHAKIPQIGTIIVEDDVEIGSCVCVDRAKFSATRIGHGTKIDNLVQIAHNVVIGPHCIVVGQAGLAGSARLGTGAVLGGQCAVRDHVTVGDGAMVAGCSAVAGDVDPKTIVSGLPALPHRQHLREQHALRHLPQVRAQLKKLQEEIELLKKRV
jgi:UDP-3-O-[3-hydroxymyristoyl] glucosamine N-acyltransferase